VITVKLGHCTQALEKALCVAKATKERAPGPMGGPVVPQFVMIIDHADILCYEPDNEASMLDSIVLAERCASAGVMVVALFDRVPGELAADRASNFVRSCHNGFFAQFSISVCYAAAPPEGYRESLFRWAVTTFMEHVQRTGLGLGCDLSAENYKELCMMTTWTTPKHILDWLNKSFREMIETPAAAPMLDMTFLKRFNNVFQTQHGPHIVMEPLDSVESRFSEACGCGPVGAFVPSRDAPFKIPEPKITTFSVENADPDVAREALLKKRKACPSTAEEVVVVVADRDEFASETVVE
jgi:hypothetical protein